MLVRMRTRNIAIIPARARAPTSRGGPILLHGRPPPSLIARCT